MALGTRGQTLLSLVKGALAAMAVTIAGMALLALLVVRMNLSDGALTVLNQALKVGSIFVGAWVTVGRGGKRGFALGAATGLTYMVLGYALYCLLDGALVSAGLLAGEFAMGAALGALSGAVMANLKPSKGRRRVRATSRAA